MPRLRDDRFPFSSRDDFVFSDEDPELRRVFAYQSLISP
jgi:hypothetical protein